MTKVIKMTHVRATYPGGRVVSGFTRVVSGPVSSPFQIWLREGESESVIINPSLAETVELKIEYDK